MFRALPKPTRTGWSLVLIAGALVFGVMILSSQHPEIVSEAHASSESKALDVATSLSNAFAQVADQSLPSVVTITSERVVTMGGSMGGASPFSDFFEHFMPSPHGQQPREYRQRALGSGVIVRGNGIILTANHVVENAENVHVVLSDAREFDAIVVGTDPETDLAVLRVDEAGTLPALRLGTSAHNRVGDWVLALGNPFGEGLAGTVTAGIISAKGRSGIGLSRYEDFIQTDAAINPGNSGGPLVNLRGELIGINTAIASRSGGYQGVGFAIPADLINTVMENILTDGRMVRGWLGVYIRDLDKSLREAFEMNSDETGGVLIDQVVEESPADKANLQDGDIILSIDGNGIEDGNDLRFRTASYRPGTKVEIRIIRNGKQKKIKVELGELPGTAANRQEVEAEENILDDLGLELRVLDDQIREELHISGDVEGVVVISIEGYSIAAEAGLRSGDVIVKADRRSISNLDDLMEIINDTDPGEVLLLKVITNSNRRFIAIRMPGQENVSRQ